MKDFKEFLLKGLKDMKNDRSEKISGVIGVLLLIGVLLIQLSDINGKIWAYIVLFIVLSIVEIVLKMKNRK